MGTPVRAVKNQYRGINAHLHSLLQTKGGWDSLHANHIIDLTRALQAQLIPMGYEADVEQSLQIRRVGGGTSYPESDVSIFDVNVPPIRDFPARSPVEAPEFTLPVALLLDLTNSQIEEYKAIAIYEQVVSQQGRGEPVAWIELLSPSNKPPASDFVEYTFKRSMLLRNGLVFVEIDYLHQSPSTFRPLANRQARRTGQVASDTASYPYRIVVVDPRPDLADAEGVIRQFRADDPIPSMTIPLRGTDRLSFDFNAPYQKTFAEMFYGSRFDYRELPLNFDLYSDDDKARIVARMLAVLTAHHAGANLEEAAPFPVESVSLDEGLARLAVWNGEEPYAER
jgi:hypothetical protein